MSNGSEDRPERFENLFVCSSADIFRTAFYKAARELAAELGPGKIEDLVRIMAKDNGGLAMRLGEVLRRTLKEELGRLDEQRKRSVP
jgi:hypothetical protein